MCGSRRHQHVNVPLETPLPGYGPLGNGCGATEKLVARSRGKRVNRRCFEPLGVALCDVVEQHVSTVDIH